MLGAMLCYDGKYIDLYLYTEDEMKQAVLDNIHDNDNKPLEGHTVEWDMNNIEKSFIDYFENDQYRMIKILSKKDLSSDFDIEFEINHYYDIVSINISTKDKQHTYTIYDNCITSNSGEIPEQVILIKEWLKNEFRGNGYLELCLKTIPDNEVFMNSL